MKNVYLLVVFFSIGLPQATGLALYGIGEEIRGTDPSSLALGNSMFFSGNSKNISSGSPSSMWRSALTRFTIHTGINYLNASSFDQQFQHILTHFSLTFPIGNKKVFGIGLQPAFRTNRLAIETPYQYSSNENGTNTAYKNHYFIDGGISKIFLLYSWNKEKNISFGIKYSFLFGNQFIDNKFYTYEVEIDTIASSTDLSEIIDGENTYFIHIISGEMINVKKTHQYAGSQIVLEGRYSIFNHEWVTRFGVNGATRVKTVDNFSTDSERISEAIISEIAIGYQYRKSDYFGIILESHVIAPFNLPDEVALFNTMPPHENSIHLGSYFQIKNSKRGFWNNINLRAGGYIKELDFRYRRGFHHFFLSQEDKYFDYGFTIGVGFEYLANTQTLDLAIRAGKRESYTLQDQDENYISLHFGITTGEKWFMKRRRK